MKPPQQTKPSKPESATERSARIQARSNIHVALIASFCGLVGASIGVIAPILINRNTASRMLQPEPEAVKKAQVSDIEVLLRPGNASATPFRLRETLKRAAPPNNDYERAVLAVAAGKSEEAVSIADKGLQLKTMPKSQAYWLKGVAAFQTGKYLDARRAWEVVYAEAPGDVLAIEDLAMVCLLSKA